MVLFECTNDALTVIDALKRVLNIVQIVLIVLLIIYCTIDVAKIVISKNDDEIKKCFGIVCNMNFILVSEYGEGGTNPELVIYKRR